MKTLQNQRKTLKELLASGDTLELPDIAEINLLSATELPGSQSLDIDATLARIDEMAKRVSFEIRRNYYRFLTNPGQADNSRAKYCVMMLVTALQQDFGIRYNPERIRNPDFRDAGDLFIHGMLGGNGGTCASMPVLYTAVGRRLGWPLKMVHARAHLFCRWDDPEGHHAFGKERFNLEATGQGANFPSDDYYRTWPEPLSDEMIEQLGYLKSLSPEAELADFLVLRGHCLEDNGWIGKACDAYRTASEITPNNVMNRAFWEHAELVRDRIIERRTLLDYFGPDVPLPIGYLPQHSLRQMALEMVMAETEYTSRLNAIERERQEAAFWSQMQMAGTNVYGVPSRRPGVSSYPSSHYQVAHGPMLHMGLCMPGLPHAAGFGGNLTVPMTPSSPWGGSPFSLAPNVNVRSLPAKLLRTIDPSRLMHRRQEAMAIFRSVPAGAVITEPSRLLLVRTHETKNIPVQEK